MNKKRAEFKARLAASSNTANLCAEVDEMDSEDFWKAIGAK
jgi:hypothetical protein